jgi:hypothetical protein
MLFLSSGVQPKNALVTAPTITTNLEMIIFYNSYLSLVPAQIQQAIALSVVCLLCAAHFILCGAYSLYSLIKFQVSLNHRENVYSCYVLT